MYSAGPFEPWEEVKLRPVPTSENYGLAFPAGMNQLMKELTCFRESWGKDISGLQRWEHGINIVRMLWPNEVVTLSAKCQGLTIWNTYFLNVFYDLCKGRNLCITGPAAASKTFAVALYELICYFSAPTDTSALMSTTSGSSAERRVWGQVKELMNSARFEAWIDAPPGRAPSIGRVIDYLKCITFDETIEMTGGKSTGRDLRNGVILIPIANDSTGENALATVVGTHNKYVLWAIDELPEMMSGVMRPRSNLAANTYTQFVGIGNAANRSDPHGAACEPMEGWDSIDEHITRRWRGKTLDVLFLHGEESPNDHPGIDQSKILYKSDYPFPYLSSRIIRGEIAEFNGGGNIEDGKSTVAYRRFAIGFWAGDDVSKTILSEQFVRKYRAHEPAEPWGPDGFTVVWSVDPAFSSTGDENIYFPIRVGRTFAGHLQVVMPHDGIKINAMASSKDDYIAAACIEVRKEMDKLQAKAENGCMDVMGDGGLFYKELAQQLNSHKVIALSSLGKSNIVKFGNLVTEYWYSARDFIQSGLVRGFNLQSGYAKDLFVRTYETRSQKFWTETKPEMKKRIGRSPDRGDAACYAMWLVNQRYSVNSVKARESETQRVMRELMEYQFREKESIFAERDVQYEDVLI